ncbi:unnamed protein product [Spodoptera exigua]|nr:unnamed protein product [Spodoptera exigua]
MILRKPGLIISNHTWNVLERTYLERTGTTARLAQWLDNWLPRNVSGFRFPHGTTLCFVTDPEKQPTNCCSGSGCEAEIPPPSTIGTEENELKVTLLEKPIELFATAIPENWACGRRVRAARRPTRTRPERTARSVRLKEPFDHHRRGPKGLMFIRGCGVSAMRYRDLGTEQEKEQGGF